MALALLLVLCTSSFIMIYKKFTVSRETNKELRELAGRDPLTNCFNRRALFDFLETQFSSPELLNEYSIVMADIDKFKRINDEYGHSMGDSVIRNVAEVMQKSVRKDDMICRFGGEEFCIVLPNISQAQAYTISEKIRKAIENSAIKDISVTCSFGVSSMNTDTKIPEKFIEQADIALYHSKDDGRNRTTIWNPSLKR
jgi:diguanylate cyclase (GGDEF)-like protein